jgi:hypothetical protein
VQDRGALTHHSCLSSRGVCLGLSGVGLGTPSPSDNARPREGVPGSTDHGLEKPAAPRSRCSRRSTPTGRRR